jgi:hypothetical protein
VTEATNPASGVGTAPAMRPTIRDVSRAYSVFLGREVENATVAGHHIATNATLWELIDRLRLSEEAKRHAIGQALGAVAALHFGEAGGAATTPDALDRLHRDIAEDWERRGLGVHHQWLRRREMRFDAKSERWSIEQCFDRAEEEASVLRSLCARHGIGPGEGGTIAVFGAEAFRLARTFGFSRYLAVEVSTSALALARRALDGVPGAHAIGLAAFRQGPPAIDLFYSVMAFQHAPPPVALDLLRLCLESVSPGGAALFQMASHLHDYRFDLDRYHEGEARNLEGEIHAVAQTDVLALLAQQGFTVLEVVPDGRLQGMGIGYLYVAKKRDA